MWIKFFSRQFYEGVQTLRWLENELILTLSPCCEKGDKDNPLISLWGSGIIDYDHLFAKGPLGLFRWFACCFWRLEHKSSVIIGFYEFKFEWQRFLLSPHIRRQRWNVHANASVMFFQFITSTDLRQFSDESSSKNTCICPKDRRYWLYLR